ncbi:lipopolysaccharide biosynthesis protein [Kosakonia sacchari]|uniref:lipopolysaccharide biosynthesis protein n=1 Tax=Kosakonia sacchari TaxID=1158459 RepID=UPI0015855F6D|nr:hypothetical protein [Kosakonia sacchari]NUL38645.1 hypothetical protein [Kosakonia sacchari]
MLAKLTAKKTFDLVSLLSGKVGNILVGVFFLPLYAKHLHVDVFGIIIILFSLQALATMLDFGMAIIVSRETAIQYKQKPINSSILKASEVSIIVFYVVIALLISLYQILFGSISPAADINDILLMVCIIGVAVLQNIYYSVLLTARKFIFASWLQIVFITLRGVGTYVVIVHLSGSLKAFLLIQLIIMLAHVVFFRICCYHYVFISKTVGFYGSLMSLIVQGKKLILYSVAGASVLQLDKIIVANHNASIISSPYFLASTFCMLPITVLATPIMQFFQPKIISELHSNKRIVCGLINKYNLVLCSFVLLPTICVWIALPTIIKLWLHDSIYVDLVITYSSILLPGIAVGALGYVPYVLLVGIADFKFQAVISFILTVITLFAVYVFSSLGNIKAICIVFFIYHCVSTSIFWLRCLRLKDIRRCLSYNLLFTAIGVMFMFSSISIIQLFH